MHRSSACCFAMAVNKAVDEMGATYFRYQEPQLQFLAAAKGKKEVKKKNGEIDSTVVD